MDDEKLTERRFTELAQRAEARGVWTRTGFLTLYEQSALRRLRLSCPYTLWGGTEMSERKIATFGSAELCGYDAPDPIVCLKIEPLSQKFAGALTHRDFLGALMSLGIRRETTGDIEILDNTGYLFCLDTAAAFIASELHEVGRAAVKCSITEPPDKLSDKPDITEYVIASERIDAIIAAVYRLSRSEAKGLIEKEKVFISGRLVTGASESISEGEIISVRGYGRFIYEGIKRETRKGRLRVLARVYGAR